MFAFVAAAGSVYAAVFLTTLWFERVFFRDYATSADLFGAVLSVLLVPTLATWLAAETVQSIFPRRVFDSHLHRPLARLSLGFACGGAGVLLASTMLALLDRALPDSLLFAVAATLVSTLLLIVLPRHRTAACPNCMYDLSGITPSSNGRCTECGFDLFVDEKRPAQARGAVPSH